MIISTRYGDITVICEDHKKHSIWRGYKKTRTFHRMRCHCGKEFVGYINAFEVGKRNSCGCSLKKRALFFKNPNYRHGGCGTRLYGIYKGIVNRCKNVSYKNYAGRGIKCEWENYTDFLNDMGDSYEDGKCIDRIDVNGNYKKDNCRWVTNQENCNNTRRNVFIEVNGEKKTMSDWCRFFGISYTMVRRRIQLGWDKKDALLTRKLRNPKRHGEIR